MSNTPPSCPDRGKTEKERREEERKKRKKKKKKKKKKKFRGETSKDQGSGMTPRAEQCLENAGNGSGFVKMLAVMSAVGIHDVTNVPSSIFS